MEQRPRDHELLLHAAGQLAGEGAPPVEEVEVGEQVAGPRLRVGHPVHAGETWSTALEGIGLPGLRIVFDE